MAAVVYAPPPPRATMQAPPNWAELLSEVGVDSADFYHQIIGAVMRGSADKALCWDDFSFTANSDLADGDEASVLSLIKKGMAPLDAIVWINGQNRPDDLEIELRDEEDDVVFAAAEVYSGFFAWYFSLFTQAKAEGSGDPNFLRTVMNMGDGWKASIRGLSTASIDKFPKEWIKHVNLNTLGEKAKNRLALGCAGHRYVASLKYIRPEDFLPGTDEAQIFITGIRNWTGDRVWWDLHPVTKSGQVITVTGSLNKMIEDCLATSVSTERKQALVQARILHHLPIQQPTSAHWANFDLGNLPNLTQNIF
jgi:hypothetical protein